MKGPFALLAIFCLSALLGACATGRGLQEHVSFNMAEKVTFYQDQWVQRSPPEVHVRPASAPPEEMRVLFIPFRVTQPMDNPTMLGYTTARTVWQTWLTMRLFPSLEFTGDDTPYRRDRAVQLGRARQVDMVVGGFVTHVYAGGTAGASQMALQLEAHDTRSGQMVWSMAQSGLMTGPKSTDFFVFTAKNRLPSDPLHAITQAMASDMGREMQLWLAGPVPRTRMQEYDQKAHDLMFGPPDPVPAPRIAPPEEETPYTNSDGGAF